MFNRGGVMARNRKSSYSFGNTAKRYATYRVLSSTEKAFRGAGKGAAGGFIAILIICVAIALISKVVDFVKAAYPYIFGIAAVALIIFVTVKVISRHSKNKNADITMEENNSALTASEMNRAAIAKRDLEIINDCKDLVNDSATLSVVESRYRLLVEKLSELSSFSDYELSRYGIDAKQPISDVLAEIESNKITIFNQAIDRSCAKALEHARTLKTPRGREQAIQRKHTDDLNLLISKGLPDECINHLHEAYAEAMRDVKAMASE